MKIAYILSVGHSGSSLLDVLLGLNTRAVSIGELKLDNCGRISNVRCTCGESIRDCEYWKAIDNAASELGKSIFDTVFNKSDLQHPAQDIVNFYKSVRSEAGVDLIVDSSKSISRLRALQMADPKIDLRVIFLSRLPFGVVASNLRRGRNWIRHAFIYLLNNASKSHFASAYNPLYVSYEDLVSEPNSVLSRIHEFLDIEYEKIDFEEFKIDSQIHMLGGNTMLYRPIEKIQEDVKWKKELSFLQKVVIGTVCHPILQKLVYMFVSWIRYLKQNLL